MRGEDFYPLVVGQWLIDAEDAADDLPERVLRVRVVLLLMQGTLPGQRTQDQCRRIAASNRRKAFVELHRGLRRKITNAPSPMRSVANIIATMKWTTEN